MRGAPRQSRFLATETPPTHSGTSKRDRGGAGAPCVKKKKKEEEEASPAFYARKCSEPLGFVIRLRSVTYLRLMDGSVARRAIGIHRGPGLRPPRGPCESLPGAALWGKILRVLYLHDNTVPKNQLWRNGRKPAEVIGCRHGEGAGPRSLRNFCMKGGAWSPGP